MSENENIIEDDMIEGEPQAPKLSPMTMAMIALAQTAALKLTPNHRNTVLTEDNGDQYYWDPISQTYKKSLLKAKRGTR